MIREAGIAVVVLLMLQQSAPAQDVARGKVLAKQRCAECHNINGAARRGPGKAPPFGEIARPGGFNANQLTIHMAFGHIPMGSRDISLADAGDVAAYIMTLRRR